jgi:dihydroorotase
VNDLVIPKPDDWHLHLRDGQAMASVVGYTARQFGRALIMPNLRPPIVNVEMALAYRDRILKALGPTEQDFNPYMALYLTDNTSAQEVRRAAETPGILAYKLYPAGATTNSDSGVTDLTRCYAALEAMQDSGVVLCVHGEVTDHQVDVFDREARFIEDVLIPLRAKFPGLRIVFEHVTTKEAADYVRQAEGSIAATITPQHLLFNRNSLFKGGLRPHYYCLPVLKREPHRQALLQVAASGSPRFFLGTDSAPHSKDAKEMDCGCAGCFSAPHAMALYAQVFDGLGRLDRLANFASRFGAQFYGLPVSEQTITLTRGQSTIETSLPYEGGDAQIVPLAAGEPLGWQLRL